MRRILLLLILLALCASASANVSLGEIQVRSFLNQPLQAQFRAEGDVLAGDEVEVRIASEDAYRRAGLQRATIPADLSIEIQGTGTSRTVRLTTMRPVREPYLGLLLEVRWAAGRVLREFTILLDPPVAFAPERSAAPVITRAPEPIPRDVPPPVVRTEPPVVAGSYTVRRGDTLSAIVSRQGYAGVTSQQAMVAILDANPQAFIDGNVNQLRADVELRLPDQSEVAAYGRQEALQEVRRQTAEWRARTAPTPPPQVAEAAPVPQPSPDVPPATVAPPPSEPLPEAALEPAAGPDAPADVADESDAVEDEAAAVVQEAETTAADSEAAVMDRLEILGEDEFEPTVIAAAGTQVIEEALLSQQVAMRELRDELTTLRTDLAERDELIRVMNSELAQLEERLQVLREQRGEGLPGGPDSAVPLHERLLADPLLLLLAATSVLLFLLLLLSLLRPRRSESAADVHTPTGYQAPTRAAGVAPVIEREQGAAKTGRAQAGTTTAVAAGAGAAAAAASAKRDERAPVSLESPSRHIDVTDEPKVEDVLADVDLYLAYGMNDQAITALENAIRDGRDDPEYRVRLIEAYAANDDGAAVRREAETLRDQLGPDQQALRERVDAAEAKTGGQEGGGEAAAPDADENMLEFDLSDETGKGSDAGGTGAGAGGREQEAERRTLHLDLDGTEADSSAERRPADADEVDELPEFTLPDLEPVAQEGPQGMGSGSDSDTSENGMKLSLAEAFVEMGDREGALALLEEILPTATEGQKAKVEAIRRQIEGSDG